MAEAVGRKCDMLFEIGGVKKGLEGGGSGRGWVVKMDIESSVMRRSEGNELSWSSKDVKSVMKEGKGMEGGR